MLELLAPAGSREALTAAVQNGANAVYLGFGDFNARRNARNFTEAEVAEAVSYCHLRGVKVYLTLKVLHIILNHTSSLNSYLLDFFSTLMEHHISL